MNIVIGIAGGSASGKTFIANQIKEKYISEILVLKMDNYYKGFSNLSLEERKKLNYDHPDTFDFDLLYHDLKLLKEGYDIDQPIYDFVNYTRTSETVHCKPTQVIVIEGILIFFSQKIRELLDIKIYVKAEGDLRFIRRLKRDMKDRGRSVDSVMDQYLETVQPMHETFVTRSQKYADLIIPNNNFNTVGLCMLEEMIRLLLEDCDILKQIKRNENLV